MDLRRVQRLRAQAGGEAVSVVAALTFYLSGVAMGLSIAVFWVKR